MTSTASDHHNNGPIRIDDADTLRARMRGPVLEAGDAGRLRANHAITPVADVIELDDRRLLAHVLSNTLTIAVDATPHVTEQAVRGAQLAGPALRALRELGLEDRVELRAWGLRWSHPGTSGVVDVDVHIDAAANAEDGTWLTITTSFSASDEDARVRLLDAWALIGPLASSLAERAARTIRERAERDDLDDTAPAALAA